VAIGVPVAETLPVELPVAVTLPLPVELPVAVAEGDPVPVATPLSEDCGESDEAGDNVATGEEELVSLYNGLRDSAVVGDLVMRGEGEPVTDRVFVFELVKDCDGLDECVGVLDCVDDLLTDAETLGDLLDALLRV